MSNKNQRACHKCGGHISRKMRSDAKYCGTQCSKAAASQRKRARDRAGKLIEGQTQLTPKERAKPDTSRDRLIGEMERGGYCEELRLGRITYEAIATNLNTTRGQVKRAYDEWLTRQVVLNAQAGWVMSENVRYLLAQDLVTPDLLDEKACRAWAREAMERFMDFEREYFQLPEGVPYLREAFHKEWIESVLFAIATGGYLQILSPPRHGKSELLIHFCIWLICRNPDIRIMWVGPNIDISTDMVGSVADNLADNERLVEDVLGPGQYFAPPKRGAGAIWKRTEFRVACQRSSRKGKTMVAVSRGKKVLSKDCDVIVCDDIEDFDSTVQPSNRANTRKWFGTGLDSRKEEHTAMVVIGSRQHMDDLYGYNLEDPNFVNIVNSAHSALCVIPEAQHDAHQDCMLFPAIRSHRWLMTKKHGAGARDESGIYEMVYLNDPQTQGFAIFSRDNIEASYNAGRGLGLEGIPTKGRRLIAGLDPSATGYQAGFMWAATPLGKLDRADWSMKRWMVDLENRRGGGIEHALELFEWWLEAYGLKHWVIEENGFQRGYRTDPRVVQFCKKNGVYLEGTKTGLNKLDPGFGVGAMSRFFPDLADLPAGNPEAIAKSEILKRQAVRFTDVSSQQRRNTSDVLMSAWFPQRTIRRWEKEAMADATSVVPVESYEYGIAYPDLTSFGADNDLPWKTGYM